MHRRDEETRGKRMLRGGPTRQEEERTKEKVYGCSEGGYAGVGSNRRRNSRERKVETGDPLWQHLMEGAARGTCHHQHTHLQTEAIFLPELLKATVLCVTISLPWLHLVDPG